MKLFWRINLSLLSSALLAFLAVGFFVNRSVTRTYREQVTSDLIVQRPGACSANWRVASSPGAGGGGRPLQGFGRSAPETRTG
jgi:hypothetical protein